MIPRKHDNLIRNTLTAKSQPIYKVLEILGLSKIHESRICQNSKDLVDERNPPVKSHILVDPTIISLELTADPHLRSVVQPRTVLVNRGWDQRLKDLGFNDETPSMVRGPTVTTQGKIALTDIDHVSYMESGVMSHTEKRCRTCLRHHEPPSRVVVRTTIRGPPREGYFVPQALLPKASSRRAQRAVVKTIGRGPSREVEAVARPFGCQSTMAKETPRATFTSRGEDHDPWSHS
uniref:Uncharacterized protein n=1 Tax=Solanum tuberosum TaxID=4113 RepID=M1DQJ1_SOLTU